MVYKGETVIKIIFLIFSWRFSIEKIILYYTVLILFYLIIVKDHIFNIFYFDTFKF